MQVGVENPGPVFWLQQAEADVPASNHWLGGAEAAVLDGLRFARRRSDWRLGRWTAKRALAAYLGCPAGAGVLQHIEIRASLSGAPEIFVGGEPSPIGISLSHRAGIALCALAPAGQALGCDLELIEPRAAAFVEDYFTAEERASLAGASAGDQPALLALLWSAKESALKALRQGLRLDTRAVIVTLEDRVSFSRCNGCAGREGWQALTVRSRDAGVFCGWWERDGELVRTVVAERPLPPLVALASNARVSGATLALCPAQSDD
jgi:4'-phosphopantetheinyl transferase